MNYYALCPAYIVVARTEFARGVERRSLKNQQLLVPVIVESKAAVGSD